MKKLLYIKQSIRITLGCRQVVRHEILILACVGSNPATPAIEKTSPLGADFAFSKIVALNGRVFSYFVPHANLR